MNIKRPQKIIEQVISAVANWPKKAKEVGISVKTINTIASTHLLQLK